jgi:hypothetical protein
MLILNLYCFLKFSLLKDSQAVKLFLGLVCVRDSNSFLFTRVQKKIWPFEII